MRCGSHWQEKRNAVGRRISSEPCMYVCGTQVWKTVHYSAALVLTLRERKPKTVGTCMTRLSTNPAACWGDTGVCRLQGHRRCDGLRGCRRRQRPSLNRGANPSEKNITIPLHITDGLVSLSLSLISSSPYFSPSSTITLTPHFLSLS